MAVARAVRSQVGVLCLLLVLALARQLSCSRCARGKNVQAADGSHHGEGNLRVFNSEYSRHEFSKDPFGLNEPVTGDVPRYGKKSVKLARLPLFEDSSTGSTIAYGQSAQDKPSRSGKRSGIDDELTATQKEFASYVRIPFRDGTYCGGVLITDTHVLTAASCLRKGQRFKISKMVWLADHTLVANETRRQKRKPIAVCFASNYRQVKAEALNDWAVLKLHKPVNLSDFVQRAPMPSGSILDDHSTRCFALGMRFRRPYSRAPEGLQAMAVEQTRCSWPEGHVNNDFGFICYKLKNSTGMRRPCVDDAGGPVFCSDTSGRVNLLAIIGLSRKTNNDCEESASEEDIQFTATPVRHFMSTMRIQCHI